MILKIRNGIIEDDIGRILGSLTVNDPEVERTIELGSEALPAVENFIDEVAHGKFHKKKIYDEFLKIVGKYPVSKTA